MPEPLVVPEPHAEDGRIERMLLEQSSSCHWAFDRDQRLRFLSGDPAPLFGKSAAELRGRHVSEIFPEDLARAWSARLARALAGERFTLRERSGDAFFGVAFFPLRSPEGAVVYAAGYAQDVSHLAAGEQELRNTTLRIVQAQESERARLARFLHDEVGQCLSAIGLQIDLLRMDFEPQCPALAPRTAELQSMLETVMTGVRDFSFELNPDIVERAGLPAAMDRLVGRSRKRFSGNLRLMADSTLRIPPRVGSALYKIAQEALDNAIQHAACSQIELIIKSTRHGPALEVRDNGQGFDSADLGGGRRGLGLLVMEHHAGQAQLNLTVSSEVGKGTLVRAVWQAANAEAAARPRAG